MEALVRTLIGFIYTFGLCVLVESIIEWLLRRSSFFAERKTQAAIVGFVITLLLFAGLSLPSEDIRKSAADLASKAISLIIWLSIQLILIAKDKRGKRMEDHLQVEE
jgi:hypothetical protein